MSNLRLRRPSALTTLSKTLSTGLSTLLLASLGSSCAAHMPPHLSSVPPGSDEDMVDAHASARAAYDRCLEDYAADSSRSSLLLASGSGALGLGLLGGAASSAVLVDDPAMAGVLVVGLGLGAGAAFASTAFFASDISPQGERAEAELRLLEEARARSDEAMLANDSDAMASVARELYENCRVVQATRDSQRAGIVLRDLQRYRRDLDARDKDLAVAAERQRKLEEEKIALAGNLDGKVQAAEARIRELESLAAEKEAMNQTLSARARQLEDEHASLSARQKKLLEEKRKLEEQTSHYEQVAEKLKAEVQQGHIMLRRLRDGVVVEMPNAVLFPSGSADLNEQGQKTLAVVAEAIKDLKDRRVRVEGHTDNVPVGKRSPFEDNWELSAKRAITVTRVLQELGVDPSMLSAEARSEYAPVVPNKTSQNRAKNRRIEIYLVPKGSGASETWRG